MGAVRYFLGEREKIIGGVAHRRYDHDQVLAGAPGGDDAVGHLADPLRRSHGRAAVLLDEQGHSAGPILLALAAARPRRVGSAAESAARRHPAAESSGTN